ncbi:MAG TPA: DUF6328 family protein [Solirubrobacterales bacterium]|nr:DUF6328 family protein [Solirubrobacterales bacterium]
MLISPTAYHRLTFRLQQKRQLIMLANWMAIGGLTFLAVAMTGAIMLVTDVLFGGVTTAVTSALAGSVFFYLWYLMPLRRRISRPARE